MTEELKKTIDESLKEIEKRVADGILEETNAELLAKLIKNADSVNEAISIKELGTTYARTGLHFDKRLDKISTGSEIKFFKKNEFLSFGKDEKKNKLIIGDNYDALLNLLIEYRNKVDVIYIDPPYSKDKLGNFAKENYKNDLSRDNLLSSLYPRLTLAKNLLASNGFIFCSIDDKNYAYVKCLFDEIFGERCFINTFVWKKNSSGKTEKDKYTINTEYVLLYSKSSNYDLNSVFKPLAEATRKLYKFDDNDGRGPYRSYPLQKPGHPGPETTYDYVDNNGKIWTCPEKGWRINQKKLKKLENDNRLILTNDTLSEKAYWNERLNEGKRIDTLWDDLPENSSGSKECDSIVGSNKFDNPKPSLLIERCIGISHPNSVVLDFYAGSGTTGQATISLNNKDGGERTFILCTNNEITEKTPNGIAYDVTSKRLKRVMTGECYDGTNDFKWLEKNEVLGGSLDVYEIAEVSNSEYNDGKTAFDVIDERLYGKKEFKTKLEKINWVCSNFENTQKYLEEDDVTTSN